MCNIIYVRLLNEGTDVYRPVLSKLIDKNIYLIGQRQDNDEKWEFEPNEIVEVEEHYFKDGVMGLIAVKKHSHFWCKECEELKTQLSNKLVKKGHGGDI